MQVQKYCCKKKFPQFFSPCHSVYPYPPMLQRTCQVSCTKGLITCQVAYITWIQNMSCIALTALTTIGKYNVRGWALVSYQVFKKLSYSASSSYWVNDWSWTGRRQACTWYGNWAKESVYLMLLQVLPEGWYHLKSYWPQWQGSWYQCGYWCWYQEEGYDGDQQWFKPVYLLRWLRIVNFGL
jgi:hypothetical protein